MSVEDAVDTLTQSGTDVLKMVHTHDGAAAACMIMAYGSAKDRKRMIKAMKGAELRCV
jgi:pumilio family protein 6